MWNFQKSMCAWLESRQPLWQTYETTFIGLRRPWLKNKLMPATTFTGPQWPWVKNWHRVFNIIKKYKQAYFPQGSNIAPAVVMEPGSQVHFNQQVNHSLVTKKQKFCKEISELVNELYFIFDTFYFKYNKY